MTARHVASIPMVARQPSSPRSATTMASTASCTTIKISTVLNSILVVATLTATSMSRVTTTTKELGQMQSTWTLTAPALVEHGSTTWVHANSAAWTLQGAKQHSTAMGPCTTTIAMPMVTVAATATSTTTRMTTLKLPPQSVISTYTSTTAMATPIVAAGSGVSRTTQTMLSSQCNVQW